MLLAVDIGNTSISFGIFEGGDILSFKMNSVPAKPAGVYAEAVKGMLRGKVLSGVVVCSVVPELTGAVAQGARDATGKDPFITDCNSAHGLKLEVENPEEVGMDRIAGSAAAADMFGPPVVVVDFGTATTVNFVGESNTYKGGAILPGISLMGKSLVTGTARLPEVMPEMPDSALGRDTVDSILSGIIYGTAGAVERIIAEVEAREGLKYKVVVTGGAHEHVLPALKRADHVEPALTLKGLRLIYERTANA